MTTVNFVIYTHPENSNLQDNSSYTCKPIKEFDIK